MPTKMDQAALHMNGLLEMRQQSCQRLDKYAQASRSVLHGWMVVLITILGITGFGVFIASALLYPRCRRSTLGVSIACLLIGLTAVSVVLFAPDDYMLRLPDFLAGILHPYRLGLMFPLLIFGAIGLAGIGTRIALMKLTRRNIERSGSPNPPPPSAPVDGRPTDFG